MKTFSELSDLTGRVALVTGAGGHLGRAICSMLAELGCRLALVDMEEGALTAVTESLSLRAPGVALPLVVDLRDTDTLRALPDKLVEYWGRLDILINNAAFVGTSQLPGWCVPFAQQSIETWRACFEVNLTAPFALSQACAPHLAGNANGAIINVSSIYGMLGPDHSLYEGTAMGNPAAYGASKGGLVQLTRYLATTLAPSVRVNAICPGGIARGQSSVFVERYEKRTPLGRMAVEEDILGAVAYFASDLSRYVTGQTLMVDGGWSIW